jgi:hypothetical protein
MVTNHSFVTDVLDRMRQAYCGLHGHDALLHFEQDRMFLKCTSCGHESPGWDTQEAKPAESQRKAARTPALAGSPLVSVRRVA